MDDTANYLCLTTNLYDPAYRSPVIDNIIISDELFNKYKQNSTKREESVTQNIYNYSNTTSDHVPISASFSFVAENQGCENIDYSETFESSLGEFTPYSVSGDQSWSWRQGYGAVMSGFAGAVNNENEDWLISPPFNLSDRSSAVMDFSHALNFGNSASDIVSNQSLWISSNYSIGAPTNATWEQLTIPTMPTGNSWTFVNSGDISIPSKLMQDNVRFAFKYSSNASVAGTWEIKNLTFKANCIASGFSSEAKNTLRKVYTSDKRIKISNERSTEVTVYDITGRIVFSVPSVQNTEIAVGQQGVYIVRLGNEVFRVIVR